MTLYKSLYSEFFSKKEVIIGNDFEYLKIFHTNPYIMNTSCQGTLNQKNIKILFKIVILSQVTPQDSQNKIKIEDTDFNNNIETFINHQCTLYGEELTSQSKKVQHFVNEGTKLKYLHQIKLTYLAPSFHRVCILLLNSQYKEGARYVIII